MKLKDLLKVHNFYTIMEREDPITHSRYEIKDIVIEIDGSHRFQFGIEPHSLGWAEELFTENLRNSVVLYTEVKRDTLFVCVRMARAE